MNDKNDELWKLLGELPRDVNKVINPYFNNSVEAQNILAIETDNKLKEYVKKYINSSVEEMIFLKNNEKDYLNKNAIKDANYADNNKDTNDVREKNIFNIKEIVNGTIIYSTTYKEITKLTNRSEYQEEGFTMYFKDEAIEKAKNILINNVDIDRTANIIVETFYNTIFKALNPNDTKHIYVYDNPYQYLKDNIWTLYYFYDIFNTDIWYNIDFMENVYHASNMISIYLTGKSNLSRFEVIKELYSKYPELFNTELDIKIPKLKTIRKTDPVTGKRIMETKLIYTKYDIDYDRIYCNIIRYKPENFKIYRTFITKPNSQNKEDIENQKQFNKILNTIYNSQNNIDNNHENQDNQGSDVAKIIVDESRKETVLRFHQEYAKQGYCLQIKPNENQSINYNLSSEWDYNDYFYDDDDPIFNDLNNTE